MKISVIVPVYNVAPYLKACLDSVVVAAKWLAESDPASSVELICVDDGSTDSSGTFLDAFASSLIPHPSSLNIQVIHQQNAGVSAARNRGMDEATGDLVAFLDADDTYDARALSIIAAVHAETDAEIFRYGCNLVTDHSQDVALIGEPATVVFDVNDSSESPIRQCALGGCSVISARLAKIVRWPSLTHCEDPLFVLLCFKSVGKAVRIEGNLYNYLQRRDSAVHKVSLSIITATCRYLVMAYDECASMPGFSKSRADTCAYLSGFLDGPLSKCGKDVSTGDRIAAEAAVRTASNLLAARDPAFGRFACREVHDFAFALGSSCTATDVLRQAGLQFGTFPLDWIGRLGVGVRTDFIVGGFADFLSADRLQLESSDDDGRHARYVDGKYGTAFFHDFPAGVPLMDSYPAVREKYDRRIARFRRCLQEARSVQVIWISDFRDSQDGIVADDAALIDCLDRLERTFPGRSFAMLVFDQAEAGSAPHEILVTDGRIRRVALDYRDASRGSESWLLQAERLRPYLSAHTVRDYRTAEERRAYARSVWCAKYEKLHARSWLDLIMADFQYRLFRHLQKRLARRGVQLL